jgi:restriction endonuclease S subunit
VTAIKATSVFKCMSGNPGLTEEFIYTKLTTKGSLYEVLSSATSGIARLGFIPVCTLGNGRTLRVFEGKQGLLVARNGKAGQMTYIKPGAYTINDHAYILSLRDDFKEEAGITTAGQERGFLLWFMYSFQEQMSSFASKAANATWNKSDFMKMNISVPPAQERDEIAKLYENCIHVKEGLDTLLSKVNSVSNRLLSVDYKDYQAMDVPISKVLDCHGGNSGLTEKEIYQRMFVGGPRYEVLSASTSKDTKLGDIPKGDLNGRPLEVLEDKEGIAVVRKGKAGLAYYRQQGKYALTDDAYFLTVKEDCKYDVSPKWLIAQYRQVFFDYSSSSDNATWNMTGFFANTIIDIPSYDEQVEVVRKYDYLQALGFKLKGLLAKVDGLLTRKVVSSHF